MNVVLSVHKVQYKNRAPQSKSSLNMGTLPKEFQDATLLAVASSERCVGIKIFHQPFEADRDGNLGDYTDRCIRDAVVLKDSIEMGAKYIENDPKIVPMPNADQYIDVEKILEQRAKLSLQQMLLKYENQFIDLGRALIRSIVVDHFDYDVCKVCLAELAKMVKCKMLTPLMLKKNALIVNWIAKLCRLTDKKGRSSRRQAKPSDECQEIRADANALLNLLKVPMGFNGPNHVFMAFFHENVKLLHELTVNMEHTEKRQLTIDPELNLMNDINDD